MEKIIVLGAGGFGISLAIMLHKNGNNVTVWSAFQSEIDDIIRDGEQKQKLPGVKIPDGIKFTSNIAEISSNKIVIFGIPTAFVRDTAKKAAQYITPDMTVVNTSKGFETSTLECMSVVLKHELCDGVPIVVLSGPSHAEEVARGIPTTVVASSESNEAADLIQDVFSNKFFRIYINNDVIGCEVGGALKNIIALCAGICDGLGYGDNTKAALMTRGISEIANLGMALGAKLETFSGLTGIGDLIVTCTSMHSRNRRAGILIGEGTPPDDAVKQIGTVEGYICCKAAWELSRNMNITMPITEQLYKILYDNGDVREALGNLMCRPNRHETEKIIRKNNE